MGTIQDLIDNAESPKGKVLNALHFPLRHEAYRPTTWASDAHAFLRTTGRIQIDDDHTWSVGYFRWGLAATSGAYHGFHLDCNGLGTFVSPTTGSKLWIVATPKSGDNRTNFEDIGLYLNEDFDVHNYHKDLFNLEAIILKPGDTL